MNTGRIRYIIAGALVVMLISATLGGLYIYHQADVIRKEQQTSEVSTKKTTSDSQKKKTDKKASTAVTEKKETEDEDSAYINKNATWNLGTLPVTKIQEENIRIRISRYWG